MQEERAAERVAMQEQLGREQDERGIERAAMQEQLRQMQGAPLPQRRVPQQRRQTQGAPPHRMLALLRLQAVLQRQRLRHRRWEPLDFHQMPSSSK